MIQQQASTMTIPSTMPSKQELLSAGLNPHRPLAVSQRVNSELNVMVLSLMLVRCIQAFVYP